MNTYIAQLAKYHKKYQKYQKKLIGGTFQITFDTTANEYIIKCSDANNCDTLREILNKHYNITQLSSEQTRGASATEIVDNSAIQTSNVSAEQCIITINKRDTPAEFDFESLKTDIPTLLEINIYDKNNIKMSKHNLEWLFTKYVETSTQYDTLITKYFSDSINELKLKHFFVELYEIILHKYNKKIDYRKYCDKFINIFLSYIIDIQADKASADTAGIIFNYDNKKIYYADMIKSYL